MQSLRTLHASRLATGLRATLVCSRACPLVVRFFHLYRCFLWGQQTPRTSLTHDTSALVAVPIDYCAVNFTTGVVIKRRAWVWLRRHCTSLIHAQNHHTSEYLPPGLDDFERVSSDSSEQELYRIQYLHMRIAILANNIGVYVPLLSKTCAFVVDSLSILLVGTRFFNGCHVIINSLQAPALGARTMATMKEFQIYRWVCLP